MIKDNQSILNKVHVLIDALIVLLSLYISYRLRFEYLVHYPWFELESQYYVNFSLAITNYGILLLIPINLILYWIFKLYNPKRSRSRRKELWNLVCANSLSLVMFIFISVLFFTKKFEISRKWLVTFLVVNIVFQMAFRLILVKILEYWRKKGFNLKHVLIVGYGRTAEAYIDRLLANPQWGYCIHGILDDNRKTKEEYRDIKIIGTVQNLFEILSENKLDEIAITLSLEEYAKLESIVAVCEKSGVHTKFVPDYNNFIPTKPFTEDLNGLPVINIRKVPLSNPLNKIIKRIIDMIGALIALIIFSIPMLFVAFIIKLTSEGPLIFSQVRIGLHNQEFKMYKFRSMEVQAESKEKKAWTTMNDPRITSIGKFIRKTSIDELPQLFNVLKGEMSLVGPRPERPFFVDKFREEIPRYMIKHQVRPGLTGWAQVNGYRGDTSIRKRIDHDLYYIENWTLGLDIKILFMTFFKGFVNKNAY